MIKMIKLRSLIGNLNHPLRYFFWKIVFNFYFWNVMAQWFDSLKLGKPKKHLWMNATASFLAMNGNELPTYVILPAKVTNVPKILHECVPLYYSSSSLLWSERAELYVLVQSESYFIVNTSLNLNFITI